MTDVLGIVRDHLGFETAQPSDTVASLGLDSLDVLELLVAIQDRMGVDLGTSDIDNGCTIEDIERLINDKRPNVPA